jgi:hypothetical protein
MRAFLKFLGSGTRAIEIKVDEGVEARVARLDAPNECFHDLHGRQIATPNPSCQVLG